MTEINHTKQFRVLLYNWIPTTIFVLSYFLNINNFLDSVLSNVYSSLSYHIANEQYFIFNYLLLERFKIINQILK